jgi:hypothetical protein
MHLNTVLSYQPVKVQRKECELGRHWLAGCLYVIYNELQREEV